MEDYFDNRLDLKWIIHGMNDACECLFCCLYLDLGVDGTINQPRWCLDSHYNQQTVVEPKQIQNLRCHNPALEMVKRFC